MTVSKVQNLLIMLCTQFNPASVPTNIISFWIFMKESLWNWIQAGHRLLKPGIIAFLPGKYMKKRAKPQLVEE